MFQAVPPPIIRSTKLYIQRQILSNHYCCPLLSSMRWNSMEFHCGCDGTPLSSITYSAHHQEHKTVHIASGIVKPILLAAVIVDEMELHGVPSHPPWNSMEFHLIHHGIPWSSISSTIVAGNTIGLTIPNAVFTVLCS